MASQTITALGNAIINLVDRKTPIATASTVGMVKPDGSTINIDANGVISSNGGGATRNIGEIVASTVPLVDAGLHLLDGALIDGAGIYSDFVSYMAGLVSAYPDLFTTESDWQSAVMQYGVCGKFVYNSTNNTVRLPKITGIIEGTTDLTALGDLVEAGLPNITGTLNTVGANNCGLYLGGSTGAFSNYGGKTSGQTGQQSGGTTYKKGNFDASLSNSIYGNSTTVQPQTIKVLYYIVVATSTKTNIQVDIDEVTTDLNGKADADLSNVPTSKGILTESYINGSSWYRVYADGWCEQGGILTVSGTSQVINFLKPYINTNYIITYANGYNSVPSGTHLVCFGNKTTNSITRFGSASWILTYWRTEGYIR